jgi:predicted  nucleic acid-binding Zn-ribbon protein
MEDITVEETKGGNNLSQKQTNYIITVLDKEVYTLDLECKKLDDKIHSLQGELHRLKNEKENKREQITTLQSYIYSLGGNNK